MQLTIHVSDTSSNTPGANVTQSSDTSSASVPISGEATNGGAPNMPGDNNQSSNMSSSSQTDIGGPPQWLTDALGKNQKSAETASAPGNSSSGGDGTDGGGAPSF
jgi:hypothetical protein